MTDTAWRERLHQLESWCPWAPEPIQRAEDLVGRQGDIDNIVRLALLKPVVVIHGETGVGKTSLFSSLSTQLGNGYHVIRCTKWAVHSREGDGHTEVFEDLILDHLMEALKLTSETVNEWRNYPQGILGALQFVVNNVTGRQPLLTLDQFEEFLRAAPPALIQSFQDWMVSNALSPEPVKVILSLRSEYLYRLQSLIRDLTRSTRWESYELLPLSREEDIRQVIRGASGDRPVEDGVATVLSGVYAAAAGTSRPFGLLPLKATLYSLFWRANPSRIWRGHETPHHAQITSQTLATLLGEATEAEPMAADISSFSPEVLNRIFTEMIDNKLLNCVAANGDDALSRSIVPQVFDQIASMRSFLATANFKEHRQLDVLFLDANQQILDFALDGTHHARAKDLIRRALDAALAEREFGLLNTIRSNASRTPIVWMRDTYTTRPIVGLDGTPWALDQDPDDKTSGPWLGLPPAQALLHLARAFTIAVDWLAEANIVRVLWESQPPSISLFHDQLSDAIRAWGSRHVNDPKSLLDSLTTSPFATLGRRLVIGSVNGEQRADSGRHQVISNARWTRSEIVGDFKNVVFVNCDLRNTRFSNCRFEGVAFVNCTLNGTLFERSTFVGTPTRELVGGRNTAISGAQEFNSVWASLDTSLSTPKLCLRLSADGTTSLSHLRGFQPPSGAAWLYSAATGIAALPISERELAEATEGIAESLLGLAEVRDADISEDDLLAGAVGVVAPPVGGIAVLGGRVSALMFSQCKFERDSDAPRSFAVLTLAYVAGSSIDFAEQNEVNISILGSAIRGLSFTRHINASEMSDNRGFVIRVAESALVNTWIGDGIKGCFTAYHSTIQALTSLSCGDDAFVVRVSPRENVNQQYVNPTAPEVDPTASPSLVRLTGNIEYKTLYRSRPAQAEYASIVAGDLAP